MANHVLSSDPSPDPQGHMAEVKLDGNDFSQQAGGVGDPLRLGGNPFLEGTSK